MAVVGRLKSLGRKLWPSNEPPVLPFEEEPRISTTHFVQTDAVSGSMSALESPILNIFLRTPYLQLASKVHQIGADECG